MDFKELLKTKGLTDDQINSVISGMKENKIYLSSEENIDTRYEKLKDKKKEIEEQLKTANTTIANLKQYEADNEKLKDGIAAFETKNAEYEKRSGEKDFNYALEDALKNYKSKNNKLVKALLDTEKLKVVDGKVIGLDEQLKSIKEENDYLFEKEVAGAPDFSTGGKGKEEKEKSWVEKMVESKTAEINKTQDVNKFFN